MTRPRSHSEDGRGASDGAGPDAARERNGDDLDGLILGQTRVLGFGGEKDGFDRVQLDDGQVGLGRGDRVALFGESLGDDALIVAPRPFSADGCVDEADAGAASARRTRARATSSATMEPR